MTRLDAIQTAAQLDAFDADAYLDYVRARLAPAPAVTLEALDAAGRDVRAILAELDRFAERSMRIRLDATADDVPVVLRKTIAATVLKYEGDLDTLRSRVPPPAADAVAAAAARVHADRAALRAGVRAAADALATAYLPGARAARDRARDDPQWAAAVHDLEDLLGEARTEAAEPRELTRGELLEFD